MTHIETRTLHYADMTVTLALSYRQHAKPYLVHDLPTATHETATMYVEAETLAEGRMVLDEYTALWLGEEG